MVIRQGQDVGFYYEASGCANHVVTVSLHVFRVLGLQWVLVANVRCLIAINDIKSIPTSFLVRRDICCCENFYATHAGSLKSQINRITY